MLVFSFKPNKLDKSKISFSFLVLEVAIGEYGITVDKLITAVDKHWENEKIVAAPIKPELEGNFQNVVTAKIDFLIQSDYYNCFVFLAAGSEKPPPPAGFLGQCYLLYKRQLMCLKRDYTLLVVRLLCHLLIGVIFGYLYMGSGYRANGVLANYVYLYGSLLLVVYTGKMAVTLACKCLIVPFPLSSIMSFAITNRTLSDNI